LHDKLLVNHTNQEIEFGDFLSCFLRASFTTHPQILALDPMEGRLFRYINFLPVSKGKAVAEKKLLTIKTSIDEVFSPQQISNRLYMRSEEHTSELQSRENLVCRLLLEKKKKKAHI